MLYFSMVLWDDEDEPDGNVQHIARHGLTREEVEDVLSSPAVGHGVSRSSGRPCVWGRTGTNKHIMVVYETVQTGGQTDIYPITAFVVPV